MLPTAVRQAHGGKILPVDILDPALVLYLPLWYPYSDMTGSTIYSYDKNRHSCSVTGAIWTPRGRSFDGDDKITVPIHNSLKPLTDSWTIILSFNTSTDQRQFFLSTYAAGEDYYMFELYDQRQLRFYISDSVGGGDAIAGDTQNLHDGKWHQVACIRNEQDGKLYLYLDGISDATPVNATNTTGLSIAPVVDLIFGQQTEGSFALNGMEGEVLIYSRALSPLEIQRIYLATKWRYV